MDTLIKYRNERKKEGASTGELRGLDGRINKLLSGSDTGALDLELLVYRRQIAELGCGHIGWDFLNRLDKHIYHTLGSKPARIGDIKVASIGMTKHTEVISVDFNNETVRDLGSKAACALGLNANYIRLILGGKHLENLDQILSSIHFTADSTVFVCQRLGCNGRCCEMGYSFLSDAMLRDTKGLLSTLSDEKLHELFMVSAATYSRMKPKVEEPARELVLCMPSDEFRASSKSENLAIAALCKALSEKPDMLASWGSEACIKMPKNCKLSVDMDNTTVATGATASVATGATASTASSIVIPTDEDLYG